MWNQARIEQHIADGVEESLTLDYKAAGALHPQKKDEIQKDVSAFANSAGGIIIYGVREHSSQAKKHLPDRIDPISRSAFSKEWLEQVISEIQPRVPGILIHPVPLSTDPDHCCYVVEIPQSETVHQSKDHRYYRRYNFENRAMEDYEVREAMHRSRHPKIAFKVRLNLHQPWINKSYFIVKVTNVGKRMAKDYLCHVMMPLDANGSAIRPVDPVVIDSDEGSLFSLRFSMPDSIQVKPLFPGASVVLKKEIVLMKEWRSKDGNSMNSISFIRVVIYADEMEPLVRDFLMAEALIGWVS